MLINGMYSKLCGKKNAKTSGSREGAGCSFPRKENKKKILLDCAKWFPAKHHLSGV